MDLLERSARLDKNTGVFIGGISNVDENYVRSKFEKFGQIFKISIKEGYGFIEFGNKNDAASAIREMNGKDIFNNGIITVRPS